MNPSERHVQDLLVSDELKMVSCPLLFEEQRRALKIVKKISRNRLKLYIIINLPVARSFLEAGRVGVLL